MQKLECELLNFETGLQYSSLAQVIYALIE